MNSDENVQKAIEETKEFISEHPEVPTVDVGEVEVSAPPISSLLSTVSTKEMQASALPQNIELPVPPLVRVTRERDQLREELRLIRNLLGDCSRSISCLLSREETKG